MYKHYIRTKSYNTIQFIIQGFCDAFEDPKPTDFLVEESDIRQYNPDLFDNDFCPKYKWENGFVELTKEELDIWKSTLPKPQPSLEEQVQVLQTKLVETQKALAELILGGVV